MLKLPKTIKWIITDFDGVITDNFVYISDNYTMTRRINFQDVIGFNNLYENGYNIAIISGESNPAMDILAKKFNITEVHSKIHNKIEVLKSIVTKYNLTQEEFLYIGDDINDMECLKYSKYKITVPHAVDKLKRIENIQITERESGFGAFREVADCLLD
jgi:YrbI family 3-deoxy-D-manno-octulosonate 8-phosphate phosphatase